MNVSSCFRNGHFVFPEPDAKTIYRFHLMDLQDLLYGRAEQMRRGEIPMRSGPDALRDFADSLLNKTRHGVCG